MTSLDIFESISVLGDVTLGVHDGLHAAGHGVGEGGEELLLPAENLPGARDLLGEIIQVRSSLHTHDDLLELTPQVLNWVEVTTLTNPVQHLDVLILEPGSDGASSVTTSVTMVFTIMSLDEKKCSIYAFYRLRPLLQYHRQGFGLFQISYY